MKKNMSFGEVKDRLKTLVVCAFISAIVNLVLSSFGPGAQTASLILTLVTLALMGTAIYTIVRYCRCPHCGKLVYLGVFKLTNCPRCKRNLFTGKKGK